MKKTLLLAVATLAMTLGPALAEPQHRGEPRHLGSPSEYWDWTKSGRMDPGRYDFDSYDTNKNGRLDDMEWKMLEDNWTGTMSEVWSVFDQNNDGKLDDQERRNVRLEWNAAHRPSPFDLNNDGYLDDHERQLYRENVDKREWK